jgi:hypothetical protein
MEHTENAAKDPDNLYYWRFDRRRLEAEAIRDAMLAVSAELDFSRPDRHPFPPIRDWHYTQHQPFKAVYPSMHRSVYLMTQRLQRHPYLALFDGADPNHSVGTRTSAIVPTQALYMMNNPFVKARAEGFARRLIESSVNAKERVALGCRLAYGREAESAELENGVGYVARYVDAIGVNKSDAELEAWTSYARILLTANEFIYLD